MSVSWQGSLFGDGGPERSDRLSFEGLRRVDLDGRSWLDVATSWLPGHDVLFETLASSAPWQQRERWMYERKVLEPRLVAAWSGDALDALPPELARVRSVLSERFEVDFDSVLVNFYRDGRDGVAWHGDTVRKRMDRAVVVTVGLGERRRFLLRKGDHGPATVSLRTGEGDLVVMGGRCQHEWQHTVPKETRAGARMSITMRHSRPLITG